MHSRWSERWFPARRPFDRVIQCRGVPDNPVELDHYVIVGRAGANAFVQFGRGFVRTFHNNQSLVCAALVPVSRLARRGYNRRKTGVKRRIDASRIIIRP